ncbi:MAG: gamma-glutamyl-gamma-aminobutyrate hydrolase PuuD [Psychroserpens sp.]|jgi:gamma-glutamyl-gamma-aminobutyrate hydrolase PuuD
MKLIGLTQRVDIVPNYNERRDALDQQWHSLLIKLDMIPIPLPNISSTLVPAVLKALKLDGIILTGGNSLSHLDEFAKDKAPERDAFEFELVSNAEKLKIPTFGVCRGMQLINHFFGGQLIEIENHVAKDHQIISIGSHVPLPSHVNSYHSWTIPPDGLADGLQAIGKDSDGNIEAFIHESKKFAGIMWHPERDDEPNQLDLNFIKSIFND